MTDTPVGAPTQEKHLDIGGVFSRSASIYKDSALAVWGAALIVMVPTFVLVFVIQGLLLKGYAGQAIGQLLQAVAGALLLGAVIRVIQDVIEDGKYDLNISTLFKPVFPKLLTLIVVYLIVNIAVILLAITLIGIPVAIYLTARWIVAMQAVIIEDEGILGSLKRSGELTKHNIWRILGLVVLIMLLVLAFMTIFILLVLVMPILGAAIGLIAAIAIYPYLAALGTVLYYELKPDSPEVEPNEADSAATAA